MSEKLPEDFEYNLKNLYHIAKGDNILKQVGENTKTATAGVISGTAILPLLVSATGAIGGFGLGGAAAAGLGVLAEKKLKKDSGQSFGAGLGLGGKLATSVGLASIIPNIGVFSFLFAAFGTFGALNILYFYLVNGKAKAKEEIKKEISKDNEENNIENKPVEEMGNKVVEKIEKVIDNMEESLKILVDGKEEKMSLEYIKNKV